ncbi:MAG: hypothetical protein JSS02_09710 [Planctomycetes bacterium]|nr:hypothetical protein [Planctomycetota bacterium]
MQRCFWAWCGCLVCVGWTVAAEPPTKTVVPASAQVAPVPATTRKQWEALLHSPAKLDFGSRKTVKVGEVLDGLHAAHHLSIRFDTATLMAMLGPQSGSSSGGLAGMALETFGPAIAAKPAVRVGTAPAISGITYLPAPLEGSPAPLNPVPLTPSPVSPAPLSPAPHSPAPHSPVVAAPAVESPLPTPRAPSPVPAATPSVPAVPPVATEPVPQRPDPIPVKEPVEPSAPYAPKAAPVGSPSAAAKPEKEGGFPEIRDQLLSVEIDVQHLDLERVSVATILRHALEAAPTTPAEEFGGGPILLTNAMVLDYLIDDDGILITTRMKALTTKETRIYSVKHLADIPPEQLVKTIRQSVRPWSWRSQINDLGEQLKGTPVPGAALTSILKTGAELMGNEVGITVSPAATPSGDAATAKSSSPQDEARQMELVGNAVVNGLVTLAQATVSALEMLHHAEPPTGTIQALGTRLVVTQSQAAHREIAELLKQLSEEENPAGQ